MFMNKSKIKMLRRWGLIFVIISLSFLLIAARTERVSSSTKVGDCYVMADSDDNLGQINRTTGEVTKVNYVDPQNGENLAVDPASLVIYNVAGEKDETPLITIDEQTASTTIINADIGLYDVDALAFDPTDGTLYAVQSLYGAGYSPDPPNPGVLYTIDSAIGDTTHVVTFTCPSSDPLTGKTDPHVDGISFHPTTGELYGAYSAYGTKSYLVTITVQTGELNLVGSGVGGDAGYTGVYDIEDISFAPDGILYGVMGDTGKNKDGEDFEGLVTIDPTTAEATVVGPYDPNDHDPGWDVEAFACTVGLTNPPAPIGGLTLPRAFSTGNPWRLGLAIVTVATVAMVMGIIASRSKWFGKGK